MNNFHRAANNPFLNEIKKHEIKLDNLRTLVTFHKSKVAFKKADAERTFWIVLPQKEIKLEVNEINNEIEYETGVKAEHIEALGYTVEDFVTVIKDKKSLGHFLWYIATHEQENLFKDC